jgi:hypothetical protein
MPKLPKSKTNSNTNTNTNSLKRRGTEGAEEKEEGALPLISWNGLVRREKLCAARPRRAQGLF